MRRYLKTLGVFSSIILLIFALGAIGFSRQEKGKMRQKGMMISMDRMMSQCRVWCCFSLISKKVLLS